MAQRGLISLQGSLNHKVVDYAGFVRTGSAALAQRARKLAAAKDGDERDFAISFAMGHDTMIEHAHSYVSACWERAKSASPERADELLEIARTCEKVPAQPAETFHEALQSLWFAYMVAGDATGRPDVIDTYNIAERNGLIGEDLNLFSGLYVTRTSPFGNVDAVLEEIDYGIKLHRQGPWSILLHKQFHWSQSSLGKHSVCLSRCNVGRVLETRYRKIHRITEYT